MYTGYWQFPGLESNSQVVSGSSKGPDNQTYLRNEGLATVICSLHGNIRNHALTDLLGLLQSLVLLGTCFICCEIFTYLRPQHLHLELAFITQFRFCLIWENYGSLKASENDRDRKNLIPYIHLVDTLGEGLLCHAAITCHPEDH